MKRVNGYNLDDFVADDDDGARVTSESEYGGGSDSEGSFDESGYNRDQHHLQSSTTIRY